MTEEKPWWQSRGVIGSLVAIVAAIASLRGWEFDKEIWTDILLELAVIIGAAVALWGRIAAHRPIRILRAKPVKKLAPANPKTR